jgi:hypothetical protein
MLLGVPTFVDDCRCIWLPAKSETDVLLNFYMDRIDYSQHVCHPATLFRQIDNIYRALDENQPLEIPHISLLLSIIGTAAYLMSILAFHGEPEPLSGLFANGDEANRAAMILTKATLDVYNHSLRVGTGTLADVQCGIISTFLLFHIEGFSPRVRFHSAALPIVARDLGLHKIDFSDQHDTKSVEDLIELEMKRRVWWHVSASDW